MLWPGVAWKSSLIVKTFYQIITAPSVPRKRGTFNRGALNIGISSIAWIRCLMDADRAFRRPYSCRDRMAPIACVDQWVQPSLEGRS